MQNDDENQSAGFGTPIDPADFARVRVAKILRSEKPLNEQSDASWNMSHHILRMLRDHYDAHTVVGVGQERHVLGCNMFVGKSVLDVIRFMKTQPESYLLSAANLNSRYVRPPWA